ncbi:hypothetical protein N7481_005891 [Penicillium waksmanii]|uniref:uncharacterized protein n=1 Tax=Penicillium waksmanii TaxID=69791 RepID=UPI00254849ED|nr:uncharacterized protein N7481_005891 [Penicillium waksmanii]KAJ5983792.1 hypothetical protein N7481_005891 [Penicillium waksmanii]
MSDAIVHGLSSESNISDHYTSLDETLGAPMSIEDLFKEFCWDEELDDLNLNTGAEGSVFLPTSYMDGSLGSTVEPSKTIATKPSEILTTDPSKTIITEPWETINEPSNTTREASETPSFPSPPTPDCYVPMPLPIPMPMSAFLKTPQEPVLPQSTRDLEEASIRVQMSILQERLTGIQQQKLQPQQDFQKQEWPEKQSWLQQPQELQQPRRFQQPRGFWQRQGLRQPEGLQQQPCPYAPPRNTIFPPAELLGTPSDEWPL